MCCKLGGVLIAVTHDHLVCCLSATMCVLLQDTKMADAAPAAKPADEAMDGDVRSNGPSEVQLLRCVSMHLAYIPVLINASLVLSMLPAVYICIHAETEKQLHHQSCADRQVHHADAQLTKCHSPWLVKHCAKLMVMYYAGRRPTC